MLLSTEITRSSQIGNWKRGISGVWEAFMHAELTVEAIRHWLSKVKTKAAWIWRLFSYSISDKQIHQRIQSKFPIGVITFETSLASSLLPSFNTWTKGESVWVLVCFLDGFYEVNYVTNYGEAELWTKSENTLRQTRHKYSVKKLLAQWI